MKEIGVVGVIGLAGVDATVVVVVVGSRAITAGENPSLCLGITAVHQDRLEVAIAVVEVDSPYSG